MNRACVLCLVTLLLLASCTPQTMIKPEGLVGPPPEPNTIIGTHLIRLDSDGTPVSPELTERTAAYHLINSSTNKRTRISGDPLQYLYLEPGEHCFYSFGWSKAIVSKKNGVPCFTVNDTGISNAGFWRIGYTPRDRGLDVLSVSYVEWEKGFRQLEAQLGVSGSTPVKKRFIRQPGVRKYTGSTTGAVAPNVVLAAYLIELTNNDKPRGPKFSGAKVTYRLVNKDTGKLTLVSGSPRQFIQLNPGSYCFHSVKNKRYSSMRVTNPACFEVAETGITNVGSWQFGYRVELTGPAAKIVERREDYAALDNAFNLGSSITALVDYPEDPARKLKVEAERAAKNTDPNVILAVYYVELSNKGKPRWEKFTGGRSAYRLSNFVTGERKRVSGNPGQFIYLEPGIHCFHSLEWYQIPYRRIVDPPCFEVAATGITNAGSWQIGLNSHWSENEVFSARMIDWKDNYAELEEKLGVSESTPAHIKYPEVRGSQLFE